jgi:long-chain acyl-CoA synthetase
MHEAERQSFDPEIVGRVFVRRSREPNGNIIGYEQSGTLWGLFRERVRRSPQSIAYRDYDPDSKVWREHSWQAIAARIDRFRSALARIGLQPSDRVALLLPNGIDWVCFDMAALGLGLVVVGLYPHDSAANNAYILGHSGARLALLDTPERWEALSPHRGEFPALERVWIRADDLGSSAAAAESTIRRLVDVVVDGIGALPACPATPDSLATLIYTSGTTGRPKGVMLSHRALLWNAEAAAAIIPPRMDDVFLSILPLAHSFERTVGYYLAMAGGSTIAYARSPQDLREDLLAVRPTVLLAVPRLYERIYAAIRARTEQSAIKRYLVERTVSIGWRRHEAAQSRGPGIGLVHRLIWPLLERLVAKPAMAAFGGRLRVAVSGGAPLDERIARFLVGLGLPLVEGYGLTEAGPVVTGNALDDNVLGSVGRPLEGVHLRVSEQGELLVRTPSVMLGYWQDEAQTSRAVDKDGWLATGDNAEIRDGHVFIPGRLKEIFVLSTGEKINPNIVEAELSRSPLFEQVAVVGERRPFLAALVVLNDAAWKRCAQDWGVSPDSPNASIVKARMLAEIEARLTALPRHAQVRAVHLSLEPWTIDAGILTPTLKVKREVLQRQFAKEIDQLYAGHQIPA